MALNDYACKRDFERTPEPAPRNTGGRGNLYLIQKHDARALHYDLRLECGGVLLSWAVPKGPSLNPSHKRLAVRTEDHPVHYPVDYAGFEGVIPSGEYGAGVVMVWDRGTLENVKDVPLSQALEAGHMEIRIRGQKLRGRWALIWMKGRGDRNWLLVKMNDEYADRDLQVTEALPDSALSGRSFEDIARVEGGEET